MPVRTSTSRSATSRVSESVIGAPSKHRAEKWKLVFRTSDATERSIRIAPACEDCRWQQPRALAGFADGELAMLDHPGQIAEHLIGQPGKREAARSEEHTSELQSLM